jgi:hypothetical protein
VGGAGSGACMMAREESFSYGLTLRRKLADFVHPSSIQLRTLCIRR